MSLPSAGTRRAAPCGSRPLRRALISTIFCGLRHDCRPAKAAFDEADHFTPEPPRPLRRPLPPPDPFPVEALGDVLGSATQGIQDKTQAPPAIGAQAVLAAATLAVQGYADVQLPTGQTRPASGFFVTVAASGERKTSADTEALWPIRKHEENLRARYEAELPGYLNAKDAWSKQRDQILGNKKQYPDRDAKRQALDEFGPAPTPPLNPMLVCPEPTLEGLERLYVTGQPSMGLFSGEGGQFIGGHGMREEAKLRTAAALSGLWDGAPIRRVRAGDGALLLPGRRLALHLMVQTEVAGILLSDRLLSSQGLLSRLLVSAPLTAAGTRLWREPPSGADAAVRRFGDHLLAILETPLPLAPKKPNELVPPALTLSPVHAGPGSVFTITSSVKSGPAALWSRSAGSRTNCPSMHRGSRRFWPWWATLQRVRSAPRRWTAALTLPSTTQPRRSGSSMPLPSSPRS